MATKLLYFSDSLILLQKFCYCYRFVGLVLLQTYNAALLLLLQPLFYLSVWCNLPYSLLLIFCYIFPGLISVFTSRFHHSVSFVFGFFSYFYRFLLLYATYLNSFQYCARVLPGFFSLHFLKFCLIHLIISLF